MNELKQIRSRFEELLWAGNLSENSTRLQKNAPPVAELLAALQPGDAPGTLCWSDIDYNDQTRSDWQAQSFRWNYLSESACRCLRVGRMI